MKNYYMKIWIIILGICIISPTEKALGQDIHYSQFYTAPSLLNPALTGNIAGKYRINLNYKRQWVGITKGGVYNTAALSFDTNIRKRSDSKHSFGLGISLMNDISSSNNKLSNLTVLGSLAAHLNLDGQEKHFLTIGLGAGFSSRRFNRQEMLFASQYNGEILDPTISSDENFSSENFNNINTRVGLVYSFYSADKTIFKAGVSMHNLIRSNEATIGSTFNREPNYLGHLEMEHYFNNKLGIHPYFLFMHQARAREFTTGANLNFKMGADNKFFLGGGYRIYNGAVVTIGGEIRRIRLGLSYDIATTDIRNVSSSQTDFEISLQYIGISKKNEEPVLPALRYF